MIFPTQFWDIHASYPYDDPVWQERHKQLKIKYWTPGDAEVKLTATYSGQVGAHQNSTIFGLEWERGHLNAFYLYDTLKAKTNYIMA